MMLAQVVPVIEIEMLKALFVLSLVYNDNQHVVSTTIQFGKRGTEQKTRYHFCTEF